MSHSPRRHTLSSHNKNDQSLQQLIPDGIQKELVETPTSKNSQEFLKEAWNNHQWIGCMCAKDAYLTIRKTTNFYVLVRITSKGDHSNDCVFSEANIPIYRKKLAEKLDKKTISFHTLRNKKKDGKTKYKNKIVSISGLAAESTKFARFMLTLYDEAQLNTVPLNGKKPNITMQYYQIRRAASAFSIAGHDGHNIIYTHPASVPKAINYLKEKQWPSGKIPQVLLFMTVDQIDGRSMLMNVGNKTYELTSQSAIEYFNDQNSPPFNVLMTLAQRPDSLRPEVLRAAAIPIFQKSWLLPIKNKIVRKFIRSILAMSKDYETYDAHIVTPFFPKIFEEIEVRPDFSIERGGATLAVFYFISEKDENHAARLGEIDFLRSYGLDVNVFDMDKLREDPERDAWLEAKTFFERYIKNFKLETKRPVEEEFDEEESSEQPINLLA